MFDLKISVGSVLLSQSPALFLAALLLIVCYFIRRNSHHVRAVLDLILAILCIAGGVALYFLGISKGVFTIKDFYQVRTAGWIGMAVVAVVFIYILFRAVQRAAERHRAKKAASRMETAHQKELEEVRQKAYASGMADAMAADSGVPADVPPAPESPADAPADVPDTLPDMPEN